MCAQVCSCVLLNQERYTEFIQKVRTFACFLLLQLELLLG